MLNFEQDLDIFFDEKHFAQPFEVVGLGTVIRGILNSPYLGMDMLGTPVNTQHTTLTIKTSDKIANQLKRKVQLRKLADNTIYQIKAQQKDELGDDLTGVTTLIIGEDIE